LQERGKKPLPIPGQLRGQLDPVALHNLVPVRYMHCTACSDAVLTALVESELDNRQGIVLHEFWRIALGESGPHLLEQLSGVAVEQALAEKALENHNFDGFENDEN
jgi:hypothetical protein